MINRREAILTGAGLAAGLMLPASLSKAQTRVLRRPARPCLEPDAPSKALPPSFFPWQEIAPGVHAISDFQTGGNVLLAAGSEESILVDTKFPSIARALLREAADRAPKLKYVVNTHHHGDHTGGNVVFRAEGIRVVAHPKAEPRIPGNWQSYSGGITGGARFVGQFADRPTQPAVLDEAGQLMSRFQHLEADDWLPDDLMRGNERTLTFGGKEAQLTHFGRSAHTDNDVVVHLPAANVLHTGDLVFAGLHPYFDPSAGVSAKGWIQSLKDARALCNDDTIVVPGHGQIGKPAIIDDQRVYLEKLIEAVQTDIEAGVPKEETVAKSWDFMDGLGFEQVRARAINAVHDELTAQG